MVRHLETFKRSAMPFAGRDSLNSQAFAARSLWQKQISREFILRNRFTERSIRVDKSTGLSMATMKAVVGSTAPYMATQETGGVDQGAVPAEAASGESSLPRRRLVRRPNKLSVISLTRRGRKGSRRQRNAVSIAMARKSGSKFVFLETERTKGIFRLTGGKRSPRVRIVWNTAKKTHRIAAQPTMQPALKKLEPHVDRINVAAIKRQLKRHRLFGF